MELAFDPEPWPEWNDLRERASERFTCFTCEDTGQLWEQDPVFPNMARCKILVPCKCQKETPMKPRLSPTDPARRKEINGLFVGKTVASVEILGVNSWTFHFTDGSQVTLDTFAMGFGVVGIDTIDN